jgi:tetratricopeptide (TPR) repeat protein
MSGRIKILMTSIVVLVFLGTNTLKAQLFQDSTTLNLVKRDIDCIYNQQFDIASEINLKISKSHSGQPFTFLLRGMLTYWKNFPLLNSNPAHLSFEEDLRQCIRLSEKNIHGDFKAEYLLTDLCARGMLLKFYDDNNLTLEVIPLVTGSYKYLRESFSYTKECSDLYYYTGVYNYYIDAYPTVYPVYKALALLFPPGNMKKGLKEIHFAAQHAVVLRAESNFILIWIYLNFENKYPQALSFCKTLHEMYPDNPLYIALYLKNLLLMKYYDEAEKLIFHSQKETENKFLQAQLIIFQGILQEKKYHEIKQAQQYYMSGISRITPFGVYGKEYEAFAYFGLSRISYARSEKIDGKKYRQKAMKLGDFKKINFDK